MMSETNLTIPPKNAPAAQWFRWALDQFNLFHRAPRPETNVEAWIDAFLAWMATGAGNRRVRTAGQCLLRCWNDDIQVPGAGDIWTEYGGMDDTNRRGVRRVLEHVRYF